jgi:UDP-galactopyranose mutase
VSGDSILVVGAGYAGAVCAERFATAGFRVQVIDRRGHIAGNAYDHLDEHGVLIHRYGPHIFHTNGERIVEYLSRFTEWRPYEHRVRASLNGKLYPFPINRDTLNQLYGLALDEAGAKAFFESVKVPHDPVVSSEDLILGSVGPDLYETFYRNYTRKQWGLDASQLKAGVAARIPVRTSTDDRYFTDSFQCMPRDGYTAMFERILDHPRITVDLHTDFHALTQRTRWRHIIYTGPIDAYFSYRLGPLPYRSLRFDHQHHADTAQLQPVGTINYPNEQAYTRITEFKHLTGQTHAGTSLAYEYPSAEGDPYYPIPTSENEALFKQYEALAHAQDGVTFVGRLAQYRYYNMDQVVGAALAACKELLGTESA